MVRGEAHLLRGVDWTVAAEDRWVVLGPNGAGKTTLLQLAAAQMHPTRGEVQLLGETLGAVDVFELRPRIGLTSAALAQRIAPGGAHRRRRRLRRVRHGRPVARALRRPRPDPGGDC